MPSHFRDYILSVILLWITLIIPMTDAKAQEQQITAKDSIEYYLRAASNAINTSHVELALKNIALAKELSYSYRDDLYSSKTSRVLAELYLELRDFKQAQELAFRATKIQRKINSPIELARSLNLCGIYLC